MWNVITHKVILNLKTFRQTMHISGLCFIPRRLVKKRLYHHHSCIQMSSMFLWSRLSWRSFSLPGSFSWFHRFPWNDPTYQTYLVFLSQGSWYGDKYAGGGVGYPIETLKSGRDCLREHRRTIGGYSQVFSCLSPAPCISDASLLSLYANLFIYCLHGI